MPAFDNEGAISYPAAFDNVIGVDWSKSCNSPLEYVYVENSIVNILGVGSELRLPWLNNSYKYVSGSSFATPFITTKIADLYQKGCTQLNDILKALKNDASRVVENISPSSKSSCYKINKAIAFPLNKEMHSVLAYSEMVDFEIVGIFDTKYSRNINVKLKDILINATSEMIVENYQNIDWEKKFDTVILGHLSPLSKVLKKNLFDEVITMCLKYKKNVYSFDNKHITQKIEDEFRDKNLKLFYPCYNEKSLSRNNLNKLYRFSTPSIAIMGTSPRQGKFTLQMEMLKYIKGLGYSVGHFCTEPTGWLLGSDVTFPIGFDSTIHLCGDDRIQAINGLMKDIERKQCDIIIIGSQSHTIPHNFGNLGFYPLSSLDLLLGCEPDVVILCINPYDEIEYINRTIGFIESYTNSKVLALCMFPLKRQRIFSLHGNYTKTIEYQELLDIAYEYREQCNRQVFILGNKEEQNYLFEKCINFFSE